jgi:hypothetical protein
MQNPYAQHTVLIVQKENHMRLEIHPPQSGGKVPGASTAVWIFRKSAKYLFQAVAVASRLFDAELPDGVVGNPGNVGISPLGQSILAHVTPCNGAPLLARFPSCFVC